MTTSTVTPELLWDVSAAIRTQVGPLELMWQDDEQDALLLEAEMLATEADRLYDELVPPAGYADPYYPDDDTRDWTAVQSAGLWA